ncbi:MAG TPA: penicillin-binding transpeptidase domain-containing protein, partial [Bryobacteraceae bacterium]|nr:penicillin-binding transpeptidase domain-containing protein [Bryobacteraceae bacterium]
ALGTGGTLGTGLGLGEADVIPAGYTDLVVSVLGEEWGFLGIVLFYGAFALLIWLSLRIARRARTDYTFFLALGLSLLLSAEVLLISAGILGLFPLSGVATPFLSYGRTAMLANFFIAGVLLSIGRTHEPSSRTAAFHTGLRWVETGLACAVLLVIGRAGWVQIARADAIAGQGALVLQADGGRRFVYNPRLIAAARTLQRGTIYDRTGLPLATSAWDELEKHRSDYQALGIDIDKVCNRADSRHYPLGSLTFHLLGDVRTRANWGAPNSSLVERDSMKRLQGYDDRARIVEVKDGAGKPQLSVQYDYRELLPLLRRRWEPDHPSVKTLRERERNVHLSLHAGLQVNAGRILKARLAEQHLERGSIVAMDPANGDLLASVNLPSPEPGQERLAVGEAAGSMLDRARYGLYPPGSTFKIVTAIAALRANPELANQHFDCIRLPDGRTGNFVGNSKRPIRDDVEDKTPHGTLDMHRAIVVSCNAYFAQLGALKVGAEALLETSKAIGIAVANPATVANLKPQMPQISYGQGQVVVSPFQMARVAAAVAGGGSLPMGRWVVDDSNTRITPSVQLLQENLATALAADMRGVVTNGTGKRLAGVVPAIAGKTGTAELAAAPSHAWFIGFAPYSPGKRIAFAVLVENGHYGGTAAAPMAGDLVVAAQQLKLIQ